MFAYGPKSYDFKTWGATGDGDYLLNNNARATNLLSGKLACMAGRAGPDDPSPIRAASPAGSASSAVPLSPAHSLSRSHSRTPVCKTEKERSRSSSASSTYSQETKPKSLVASGSEDGNDGNSANLKKEMRRTPTVEPQVTAKAQIVAALMGKVLAAAAKFQMLMARKKTRMGKPMNPAVRLKGQMLKVVPALQNLMMKF